MRTAASMNRRLGQFAGNDDASVMPMIIFGVLAMVGFGVLAVDFANGFSAQRRLQAGADAAALAAARQMPDSATARTAALAYAEKNLPASTFGAVLRPQDIVTGNWNTDSRIFTPAGSPANATQVTLRRSAENGNGVLSVFGRVFGIDMLDITVSATAVAPAPTCAIALAPGGYGLFVNSGSTVTAAGCRVQVNSSSPDAAHTNSGSTVTADSMCVHGGHSGGGISPPPQTGCAALNDPLASIPTPDIGACDHGDLSVKDPYATISPGTYCGKLKIDGGSTVTMEPGEYVFNNAELLVNSGATLLGNGVMIYLAGLDSTFTANSGSHVELHAVRSGPRAGVVLFGDRDIASVNNHLLNSDSTSIIEGTIYLPKGDLFINSGSTLGAPSPLSLYVVNSFDINSSSHLYLHTEPGNATVPVPGRLQRIQLVR